MPVSDSLRWVVIGVGASIFPTHRLAQLAAGIDVVAVCGRTAETAGPRAAEIGCPLYTDYQLMLTEVRPDAAVVLTPHPSHPAIAIDCMRAGAHVLVEKPMAPDVGSADRMIAEADRSGRVLAVSFQGRFRPAVERAKHLIGQGVIGPLVRTLSVEPWFRTEYYYRTASWRARWKTEGGGVLMNQAPHTLDALCHLAGLPSKVWGWTRTRYHNIEVEDTAQAMLEYANGAPGYLTASTGEVGVEPLLQIVGEKGAIELSGNRLTVRRNSAPCREYMAMSQEMFGKPDCSCEAEDIPDTSGGHLAVYQDFAAAVRKGRQPRCNGSEGLMSLELANAIVLSSCTDRAVPLPVDRDAYSSLLAELQAGRPLHGTDRAAR